MGKLNVKISIPFLQKTDTTGSGEEFDKGVGTLARVRRKL